MDLVSLEPSFHLIRTKVVIGEGPNEAQVARVASGKQTDRQRQTDKQRQIQGHRERERKR